MADDNSGDLSSVALHFHNRHLDHSARNGADCSVYLGEVLQYDILITKPEQAELTNWKQRVSQLSAFACLQPAQQTAETAKAAAADSSADDSREHHVSKPRRQCAAPRCSVVATYTGTELQKTSTETGTTKATSEKTFRDSNTCVMPMSTYVCTATQQCGIMELSVSLWLASSPRTRRLHQSSSAQKAQADTPSSPQKFQLQLSSPQKQQVQLSSPQQQKVQCSSSSRKNQFLGQPSSSQQKCLELSPQRQPPKIQVKGENKLCASASGAPDDSKNMVQHKSLTRKVRVRDCPHLKVRSVSCGQQHLLLAQVKNTSRQTITIKNLTVEQCLAPSSRPGIYSTWPTDSRPDGGQPMVSVSLCGGAIFPVILAGLEELALTFRLDLSLTSQQELTFQSYLKWTHPDTSEDINTVYRLPKVRVRYPSFTVSVQCEGPVETGKTFYLTYNIANNLQDFLSVRLYWGLESQLSLLQKTDAAGAREDLRRLQTVKRAIICHDPDIFIGSCPRGNNLPVTVGFQILHPGIYEFGELMKLNLRWALPDSHSTLKQDSVGTPASSDTVSTLSADDQLLASTELWRDRSGSTCSLHTPTSQSAQDRRKTFATKSYSFGDLGPTLSTDSEDTSAMRSTELRRDRSSSTCSLHTPTSQLAQDRRKTFATKSYSFGDLGPTLSTDSEDTSAMRFKSIKRSTAVLPPRAPPPGSLTRAPPPGGLSQAPPSPWSLSHAPPPLPGSLNQPEKDLTNRNNFLKKSFQIYIPSSVGLGER